MSAPEIDTKRVVPFRAVLLYEDVATGVRAKRIGEFVVRRMGPVLSFDTTLWNVSRIEIDSLNTVAAEQAASAEIVVISLRDGSGLSSSLRMWINQWIIRRKGTHSAMIVLFDSPGPESDFARRHLRNAARRAGMEFFTQTGDFTEPSISSGDLLLAV